MAWRPYENLINGELDNRVLGKVTGWIRFHRSDKRPLKVRLDLMGDFHDDIRGKVIRLSNPNPTDRNQALGREGTYMERIAPMQRGTAGDITAGIPLGIWTADLAQKLMEEHELSWEEAGDPASEREDQRLELARALLERVTKQEPFYPYVPYPYIEWYSEANGRVVLELDPGQVEIVGSEVQPSEQPDSGQSFRESMLVNTVAQAFKDAGIKPIRDA